MIQDMTKNYKLLRTIHHDFYTTIAENFQYYLGTLTQPDFNEIDTDIVASGLNSLQNVDSATEILVLFDFYFYFVNGRYPLQPCIRLFHAICSIRLFHDLPMEVNGEELNIKKLYEKFRTTNSYDFVSSQFLATLNIFFGGDSELNRFNRILSKYESEHSFD